jgi:hypothetical protein
MSDASQLDACVCSVITFSYAPFADVLAQSIHEHHPGLDVLICVVDGAPADAPAGCIGVPVSEMLGARGLNDMFYRYDHRQFSVACKSAMLQTALARGYERAIFLDVDMLVLDSLSGLLDPASGDIVLTPHLLAPEAAPLLGDVACEREQLIIQCGVMNGGCIAVSAGQNADAALTWLTKRLQSLCLHDIANGLHHDQTWLDLMPGMFDGVRLHRDEGVNVAYWNLPERPVRFDNGVWSVGPDASPLRLFHFSGYDPREPARPTKYRPGLGMELIGSAEPLYRRYHDALVAAGVLDSLALPSSLDTFADGSPITDEIRAAVIEGRLDATDLDPKVAVRPAGW